MRATRRLISLLAVATLVAMPASLPALAQSGTASDVTHRQSVRTEMSPEGEVEASRIFTQLTVVGDGQVDLTLTNQSTTGLRNLDGFGRPRVEGDQVIHSVEASRDGTRERTVADNTADLPIELGVTYSLDGEELSPNDLVGKSGDLTVTFDVRNTTAQPTEIRYFDGAQNPVNETIDVAVPFVGSVSMTLPPQFVDIDAPAASVAGDGRGNTAVSWSMVLFEPVGSEEQSVSYTARVTDAVVPEVVGQFLPVDSRSFSSLRSVQDTFGDVADGLTSLTTGALIVDGNVRLLAAGAAQLFDGLDQLADGAEQLSAGLNESAIPGSRQLADGTGAARAGGRQLADGLLELQDGAGQLSGGLSAARAGSDELAAGLAGRAAPGAQELAAGLAGSAAPGAQQLATGLETQALPGAVALHQGIQGLRAAMGAPDDDADDGTVIGALNSLVAGLETTVLGGIASVKVEQTNTTNCNPAAGQVAECGIEQLTRAIAAGQIAQVPGLGTQLATFGTALKAQIEGAGRNPTDTCVQVVVGAQALQGALGPQAQAAAGQIFGANAQALGQVVPACLSALKAQGSAAGLGQLEVGIATQIVGGMRQLLAGLDNPACDPANPTDPANPCGARQVLRLLDEGGNQLVVGLGGAVAGAAELAAGLQGAAVGAGELATGIGAAAQGTRDLNAGLVQLDDGAGQLAAGAGTAADGANDLANGLVQLDDGTNQLADGLGDAGDGSQQIAEGLVSARDGGEQIADGTQALTDRGMSQIIEGASEGAKSPAQAVAHARAADARGKAGEGLPYGTVDGATASAVYQFELAGIGGADDGASTPVKAAATLAAFGIAGALGLGLRRTLA